MMKYQFVFVLIVSFCCIHWANAQPANLDRPAKLRVTGTLLPMEERRREDLVTVRILVEDTPLLLRVGKVEELTSMEREQAVKWGVLLRQVRFYGPEEFIGQLRKPEAIGKIFTIEGQLDTRDRQFLVTSVVAEGKEQSPEKP
ncbi:MAG: hypothetical protein AB7P69_07055 [Candidatus Binatia bacterium]